MHPLLGSQPRSKLLLLGNEAIVRGALEAGVAVATAYPGTPSSEIADTFFELGDAWKGYFEYSTNEKVALEVAAAAAVAKARSMVSMKHVGLNVAADPLNTLAYSGVRAGMVIVTADDPSMHSSQNEQDNRYYAKLSLLPMLEPSTPDEALRMTRDAFEISERARVPVLLRTTTRVSHARGVCLVGEVRQPSLKPHFDKDPTFRFVPVPRVAQRLRLEQLERQQRLEELFEQLPYSKIEGSGELTIVASGIAREYVLEVVQELGLEGRVRIAHVAGIHPLPRRMLAEALRSSQRVLVVEELEPILETEVRALANELGLKVPVFGKGEGWVPRHYELCPDRIRPAVARFAEVPMPERAAVPKARPQIPPLPDRPPLLCAGCTHRASYYAIKAVADEDTFFATDIGCYTLALLPPLSTADAFFCMGSSVTQGSGTSIRNPQKVVAFIGDSTFFHSGLSGLANAVHNQHDLLLVILDNGTTAMTGHQPHPGTLVQREGHVRLDLEQAVRGLGVRDVTVVDPMNLREAIEAAEGAYRRKGVRVLITRHPCPLYERRVVGKREEPLVFQVAEERCQVCGTTGRREPCGVPLFSDDEILRSRARILSSPQGPDALAAAAQARAVAATLGCAPCTDACPANICAMGYVSLVRAGRYREALQMIRERVPLPATLGRVCPRPCEKACVRGPVDGAVSINALKRFVAERETPEERAAFFASLKEKITPHAGRVAVIGSGPAGLAAAYELRLRGYEVTIFEREKVAGGIPAWGIPEYRLPRKILQAEIEGILSLGVHLVLGKELGRGLTLKQLVDEGYDGIVLALGCMRGLRTGVPGQDLPGVVDALSFLREVSYGIRHEAAGKVIVVGGGDAAIDAARTALRLGASEVEIVYRRSLEEMPAAKDEVEAARSEGVTIRILTQPVALEARQGGGLVMRCVRNTLGEPDASGRRRPVPIPGSEFAIEADMVLEAIGQEADLGWLEGDLPLDRTERGGIRADTMTGATSHPRIFVAGDLLTGPATVIQAIATGMRAAWALDRAVRGEGAAPLVSRKLAAETVPTPSRYVPSAPAPLGRTRGPARTGKPAKGDFAPVEEGLLENQARAEATRCFACGLCGRCTNCIDNFGCPAFVRDGSRIFIDEELCIGCGVCAQLCANAAIVPVGSPETGAPAGDSSKRGIPSQVPAA